MDPPLRLREDWWVFEDLLRLREDWWVFEDLLRFQGNTFSFSKVQETTFIFSNVKKVLLGFRKTSFNAKEVFRKPFLSPIS